MPISEKGIKGLITKYKDADNRLKLALDPIVGSTVHAIGERAKQNAGFSSQIPGQEYESHSFLGGTVGFTELGYPHGGKVFLFEGNTETPTPFIAMVYGGPGESKGMTHPFLGPAAEAERPGFYAEARAAVHKALS